MRLTEINLLGVYVAPLSVIMACAWILLMIFRRLLVFASLTSYIWHPALFSLAVYVIFVSSIVLFLTR